MSQRNRAIIFGIAGAVLLIVGAVGLITTLSDDDGDTAAERPAPNPSTPTSTVVTTTQPGATTTPEMTNPPATSTTLPATTTTAATTTIATTTTSSTTTSTSRTTTTVAPEDSAEFMNALIDAQAAADVDFLTARLHPEVLTRYGGAEPCRTYLESITFPAITLREINDPAPWDFATDGLVTTFPDAIGVEIQRIVDGETIIQELHIVYAGPELRWFTDCGEPV